ncbi:zinc-dependent metalloprotease family protein [Yersinia aleksiciae]|uniref:zinc-dependent metalloprotease family protein n=1 Tax=Yersinia aleksiciae TaxID=263819 RepID=UPI0011A76AF0|nr:zinc-dependent metalloprotease family protein [Yersinia aleksiciae]
MSNTFLFTTPNQLGGGVLPSRYDEVIFELSDGNWVNDIVLPEHPADKSRVVIRSSATWDAKLQLPFSSWDIKSGNQYVFEYNSDIQRWNTKITSIDYLTPNSVGHIIPDNPQGLTYYSIDNCNYVAEVTLPAIAEDGDVIIMSTSACKESQVSDSNILYGGTRTIKSGIKSIYMYQTTSRGSGWMIDSVSIEPQYNMSDEISDFTVNVSDINDSNEIPDFTVNVSDVNDSNEMPDFTVNVSDVSDSNEIPDFTVNVSDVNDNDEILDSTEYIISTGGGDKVDDTVNNEGSQKRKVRATSSTLYITPSQLGSGVLPSGYDKTVFEISNGNWTRDIILPLQPVDKSSVIIKSSADWDAYLLLSFGSLKIKSGSEYILEYRADMQQWDIKGPGDNNLTPNSVGHIIPDNHKYITFYVMDNDDWVPEVTLPSSAEDQSIIIIRSAAIRDSKVAADHLLFASTTTIKSGDQYVFKYLNKFNRWVIESAPIRDVAAGNIQDEIPYPTSQTTLVTITDNSWRETIKLPEKAADRDKIALKSSTDAVTYINADNVNEPGVMKLQKGEQYDFFYIAEKGKWQLVDSPDTLYQAQDIINGNVPALRTPRTIINATNEDYQSELKLPTAQESGSRVIINNGAKLDISITADETNYKVSHGETVAFKVDEQGLWYRETVTIDLLLLYSDKAAAHSGKVKVHDFMMKGLDMTNEALENSGANFRFRMVGLREIEAKDYWTDMLGMLENLQNDSLVQRWRDDLKADGVYYVGTEAGCGRGWMNNVLSPMDSKYMFSVGSINCGPEVMRHELGHNMGLDDKYGCDPAQQDCELVATIMNDMWVNYYSTPDRYTADHVIPIGILGKFDDVMTMNKMSAVVAAYR